MRLLRFTAPSPAEDLALEEALQLGLEEGTSPPTWRVWQAARPALVLGTGQEAAREADLDAARAAGTPVLRRHSGGGAVLIGPGVICYSGFYRLADLPGAQTIRGAMTAALRPVIAALARLGVESRAAGLSDLVVSAADGSVRKLAGNAQARKRVSVLVHGTLLADPDWALMERLLRFPSRPPEYRAHRGHRDFLVSLRELGAPVQPADFSGALEAALLGLGAPSNAELGLGGPSNAELGLGAPSNAELGLGAPSLAPLPAEMDQARALAAAKYARDDWNLRR